jgi:hypothetical protein
MGVSRMKLRVTLKELNELTVEQKQNLCDLWIPNIYDVAVASVCVDAVEEKYGQIVYVIGGIKLLKHHDIMLYDSKFMQGDELIIQEEEACSDNIASDRIDGIDNISEVTEENTDESAENTEEEFSFDEDFNFEFQRPDSYTKLDCLPLLDIGQMLDILERKNFGQGNLYISASIDDFVYEMGTENPSIGNNYDENAKNCELCDILWQSVKALL